MSTSNTESVITTDVLIVGAGPAGASLACFLAYYGISGLMITKDKHSATQPRAHLTNMATFECLRDIGLEDEYRSVGFDSKQYYGDQRWCYTLAGADIIRQSSYAQEPQRYVDYEEASPCSHADVSQNIGEPVLHKYATSYGFDARFSSEFLHYSEDESGLITSTIRDMLTGYEFKVVSKYLCGADGASSKVASQSRFRFSTIEPLGVALNVWYEADLSHIYKNSPSMLNLVFTPHLDYVKWGMVGTSRVVKPYSEFMMGMVAHPSVTSIDFTEEDVMKRLRELIGDDDVPIKIKGIYRWRLNESYAETISNGKNIFCLGDAIHRHSPGKGLGLNTGVQDAYNLAWKLAYVLKGKADPKLLESYNAERQPIAKFIVSAANDTLHQSNKMSAALGLLEPTVEARMAALKELGEATPAGAARRAAVKIAHKLSQDTKSGLGAEMNQAYKSPAVYLEDESDPNGACPEPENLQRHHVSTHPGARLPHAWLGTDDHNIRVSTHDVAGKGDFTLFTGVGGTETWVRAANDAMAQLAGVQITVRTIGFGQEFSDMYHKWAERRGVEEDGAVLVRPDRTVAWRCKDVDSMGNAAKLTQVMKHVLG